MAILGGRTHIQLRNQTPDSTTYSIQTSPGAGTTQKIIKTDSYLMGKGPNVYETKSKIIYTRIKRGSTWFFKGPVTDADRTLLLAAGLGFAAGDFKLVKR